MCAYAYTSDVSSYSIKQVQRIIFSKMRPSTKILYCTLLTYSLLLYDNLLLIVYSYLAGAFSHQTVLNKSSNSIFPKTTRRMKKYYSLFPTYFSRRITPRNMITNIY